jgi:hypothetical protein
LKSASGRQTVSAGSWLHGVSVASCKNTNKKDDDDHNGLTTHIATKFELELELELEPTPATQAQAPCAWPTVF